MKPRFADVKNEPLPDYVLGSSTKSRSLQAKQTNDAYRDGWDRVFGGEDESRRCHGDWHPGIWTPSGCACAACTRKKGR